MKTIGITADHAGYEMKELLRPMLLEMGYNVRDFGTNSTASVDYPDFAHQLANALEMKQVKAGIALCGTGNGMAITLNKHQHVRAGLAWNVQVATLIRLHNDANICVLPARFIDENEAKEIVKAFLETEFEGGRHTCRVEKISINGELKVEN
ncbi:MAG: RpiB/LacA/LacB family sugar-phosphate isomerase [Prevotellaceae bacterium]|jgi:ribose 5-phosphate isomerase B|nr:RpiB/LacA/LacB family sugar-phosphate isomerase [Prevotellaceae bacterium]